VASEKEGVGLCEVKNAMNGCGTFNIIWASNPAAVFATTLSLQEGENNVTKETGKDL
jgi:hypothetical protein